MTVLKNWESKDKYFEVSGGGQRELGGGASYQGFGFKKKNDFFAVYKDGGRLALHVNGKDFYVEKDSCDIKYSNNPLFERVRITSNRSPVFSKTYWLLGKLKDLSSEQPMDGLDEQQHFFFPWLKKVVEKRIPLPVG
jgi:hypothetical protein